MHSCVQHAGRLLTPGDGQDQSPHIWYAGHQFQATPVVTGAYNKYFV